MSNPDRVVVPEAEQLLDRLRALGETVGLAALGVTTAEPFIEARRNIEERKARGLSHSMWFTYGRPERSTDPGRIMPTARSVIAAALDYHADATEAAEDPAPPRSPTGTVARFVWERHYEQLRAALEVLAAELRGRGWAAEVVLDDNRMVDRAAAYRAGLGWFGKNTNLLLDGAGSWVVLGTIVTDCVLPVSTSVVADGCGTCIRCQIACPTGALDVAGELDARRCLAWLVQADGVFPREHRVALGDRIYGCDDCQEVCPPNARHLRIRARRDAPPTAHTSVDVVAMLDSDDETLMAEFGHWYVPRRRAEYLRRNALLVLANTADRDDPAVRRVLTEALTHPSEIVRAHAVWAARRLGIDGVVAVVAQTRADEHPDVIAELDAAVELR